MHYKAKRVLNVLYFHKINSTSFLFSVHPALYLSSDDCKKYFCHKNANSIEVKIVMPRRLMKIRLRYDHTISKL